MSTNEGPWLEYRLRRLVFRNGGELGFRGARMLYNEDDHIIALEEIAASQQLIDQALAEVANADGTLGEIKTIYYDMIVTGHKPLKFYHPIGPGARVRLLPRERGRSRLFFAQEDGAPMFSKNFTLRSVSEGQIDSDKRVWQFHGYKHAG